MNSPMAWLAASLAAATCMAAAVLYRRGRNPFAATSLLLIGPAAAAAVYLTSAEPPSLQTQVLFTAILSSALVAGIVCGICGTALAFRNRSARLFSLLVVPVGIYVCVNEWQQLHRSVSHQAIVATAVPVRQAVPPPAAPTPIPAPVPAPTPEPRKTFISPTFAKALRDTLSGKKEVPEQMAPIVMERENFKLTPPGKWDSIDPKMVNQMACCVLKRWADRQTLVVIAEQLPAARLDNLDPLADFVTGQLSAVGTPKRRSKTAFTHEGAKGVRVETELSYGLVKSLVTHLIISHRGFLWQLVLEGPDTPDTIKTADQLLAGFSILDKEREAQVLPQIPKEPTYTSAFGWSVDLSHQKGIEWNRKAAELERDLPSAEYCVMDATTDAALFVRPMWLPEENVSAEALADGLLSAIGAQCGGPEERSRSPIRQGSASGFAMVIERKLQRATFEYHVRILQDGRRAWMLCAYTGKGHSLVPKLDPALDAIQILPSTKKPPATFSDKIRRSYSLVFNSIGLHFDKRDRLDEAFRWLRYALDGAEESVILANFIAVAERAGREAEALPIVEANVSRFRGNRKLEAQTAILAYRCGELKKAADVYRRMFEDGHRNDEDLDSYTSVLVKLKNAAGALKAFDQFVAKKDAPASRRTRAVLLAENGKRNEAIESLRALRNEEPAAPENLSELASQLSQAGKHDEVIKEIADFTAEHGPNVGLLRLKASSELTLKRYREAKQTYEAAMKEEPDNEVLKKMLAFVSSRLGEGDNSQIKKRLEPVAIPASFLACPPEETSDFTKGYNAYCRLSARAISIEKDGDHLVVRSTEHRIVKILDREGAERFNTLSFEFHPGGEEFFLNNLKVRDEKGDVIGEGRVEDCYVLDHPDEGMATSERTVHAPVPGLRPGCTLEYSYTRLERLDKGEPPFIRVLFGQGIPVLRQTLSLRAPTGVVAAHATQDLKPTDVEGAQVWTLDHPATLSAEPYMATWTSFTPSVVIGDQHADWSALGKSYLGKLKSHLAPTASLDPMVAKLIKGLDTDADKVKALAKHVQEELTYKAIEFGHRALIPQDIATITRNKYGDCKDHALLLFHLLRCAKIPAYLALINSGGTFESTLPSLDQFDHAIVYVPGVGDGLFVDCTQKSAPFDESPPYLSGFQALVLDPANPVIRKVPSQRRAKLQIEREVAPRADGDLDVRETVSISNEFGSDLRDSLRYSSATVRRQSLQSMLKGAEPSLEISDLQIENLSDTEKPLRIVMQSIVRRKTQKIGDRVVLQIPAAWEEVYLDATPVEKRRTPFELRLSTEIETSSKLKAPAGWKLESGGDFHREPELTYASGKADGCVRDGSIEIQASAQLKPGNYPATDYEKFVKEMETMKRAFSPELSFSTQ